jgi:hypothetical protein
MALWRIKMEGMKLIDFGENNNIIAQKERGKGKKTHLMRNHSNLPIESP